MFELRLPRNNGSGADLERMLTAALEHHGTLRVGVNPRARYTTIRLKSGKVYRRKRPVPVWLALMWNEYGIGRVPARRPIRTAVMRRGASWGYSLRSRLSLIKRGVVNARDTMMRLGRRMVADIRVSIDSAGAPNARATVRMKGFNRPMIWTKKLLKAIQYEWIPDPAARSQGAAAARRLRSAFDKLATGKVYK